MDEMIESRETAPTYGYYLIYGVKGAAHMHGTLLGVKQKFFRYLREAKAFVGQELTTDHQVVSLIRGKAVEFRIESRLTV